MRSARSISLALSASLATLATVAILGAAPALAQAGADQTSVQVPGAQRNYQLQPQQVAEVAGVYRLDNGGVFRMIKQQNRLMAQLDDRPVTELLAQADNRFISREQAMTVDYTPQAFGDLITLRYRQDLARADSPMMTVTLARN